MRAVILRVREMERALGKRVLKDAVEFSWQNGGKGSSGRRRACVNP